MTSKNNFRACPEGFKCVKSTLLNTGVCCSGDTASNNNGKTQFSLKLFLDVCFGETPLAKPNPCSSNHPCPAGYTCRVGRCCPTAGKMKKSKICLSLDFCPAGAPLAGITSCSASEPCPNNYQCVTNNGQQFCCPAPEHVCGQPKNTGTPCGTPQLTVARYFFDTSTGSCRAFQYSQCGGNANNFDTLEQCEGLCLASQCPQGEAWRMGKFFRRWLPVGCFKFGVLTIVPVVMSAWAYVYAAIVRREPYLLFE